LSLTHNPHCSACIFQADDRLALLQHGTRLYLVDTSAITKDLFRQLLLVRWEAPRVMALAEPLPVKQLMAAALQLEQAASRWQVRDIL
jgi:DNA mismatch repair protein MLH1